MADQKFKVVSINKNDRSSDDVIERLEQALQMARDGGIDNCAVIMTCTNGNVIDCWANNNHSFLMVGAMESLKKDFMNRNIESR